MCPICYSDEKALYVACANEHAFCQSCLDKHLDYCAGRFETVKCPTCRLSFAKSYRDIVEDRYNEDLVFLTSFKTRKNPYYVTTFAFHTILIIGVMVITLWFLDLIKPMIGPGVFWDILSLGFYSFVVGFAGGRLMMSRKSIVTDHFYGIAVTSQQNKLIREDIKNRFERIFPNKLFFTLLSVGSTLYAIQILSHFVYNVFFFMVPIILYAVKSQLLYPSDF